MDFQITREVFDVGINIAWFIYFLNTAIRSAFLKPFVVSCRWFFSIIVLTFIQAIFDALYYQMQGHPAGIGFYLKNYLALFIYFIFMSWLWLKPKSYIAFGVTSASLREAVIAALTKMNVTFEEVMGGFRLASVPAELKVSVNEWLGRAKIRFKDHQEQLLDGLAGELNGYFEQNTLKLRRTIGILYLLLSLFIGITTVLGIIYKPLIPQNGYGVYQARNGDRYEGRFKNYILQGQAVIHYYNGSKFAGEVKSWLPDGKGTFTSSDGRIYRGDFKDGEFLGKGVLTYGNGSRYEGDFKGGFYSGTGTFTQYNGTVYSGDFKNGRFEGEGTIKLINGDIYKGEVKNWLGDGQGVYAASNNFRYEGNFRAGVLQGRGIIWYANGSRYEGDVKNWLADGQGVLVRSDGSKYEGLFKNDLPLDQNPAVAGFALTDTVNGIDLNQNLKTIDINPVMDFKGMIRSEIFGLRQMNMAKEPDFALANYQPNPNIFQIHDGKPWWGLIGISYYGPGMNSIVGHSEESRFFLNPYLLFGIAEGAGHIVAGSPSAPDEIYPKPLKLTWEKSGLWAHVVYNVTDYYNGALGYNYADPRALYLNDYNARDFGFNTFVIDSKFSTNISAATDEAIPIIQYIHVGGSCGYPGGCNNMSPHQDDLRIQWVTLPARVYLKLWRKPNADIAQKPDMDFIIDLK